MPTRSVRVTPDGQLFAERAQALVGDADELQALFQRQPAALRGRLRVDMPGQMSSQVLIPRLPEFLAAHPQIEVELSSTDRRVDLVHEGFDCVIRAGQLTRRNPSAKAFSSTGRPKCRAAAMASAALST